jgi:two-component sensor histidine kinase
LAPSDENAVVISVRDDGVGLPADFDLDKSRGLGMRIVGALSRQLHAAISHRGDADGTEFVLTVPLQLRANG